MNLIRLHLRTPVVMLRAALAQIGLRTEEDYDELVFDSDGCSARVSLSRLGAGQLVRCFVSVDEDRLRSTGLEVFSELSLDGHPVVAYGAGRGRMTFEFEWLHTDCADWRLAGRRVELCTQLLRARLGPPPRPMRNLRRVREPIEGILAHPMPA